MKIEGISTYQQTDGHIQVDVRIDAGSMSVADAVSMVLAKFAGTLPVATPQSSPSDVTTETAPAGRRTRAARTTAAPVEDHSKDVALASLDAAKAAETAATTPAEGRRTRRTAPDTAPAETVPTVTDIDLMKACSNTAAIIGVDIVQEVVADTLRGTAGEAGGTAQHIPLDLREKFLKDLEAEVTLFRAEAASKSAA